MLQSHREPHLLRVRSDAGEASVEQMELAPITSAWRRFLDAILIVIALASIVYFAISTLSFLGGFLEMGKCCTSE
jgi:hypothetical protein